MKRTASRGTTKCLPGCPPRPEQLIYAITLLQKKIEQDKHVVAKLLNRA